MWTAFYLLVIVAKPQSGARVANCNDILTYNAFSAEDYVGDILKGFVWKLVVV